MALFVGGTELSGGGITMIDQWRVTSNITSNQDPISSNLEQVDTGGQGTLGSAMTVSSGIFTFPSTGLYSVRFNAQGNMNSGGGTTTMSLWVTTNNSTYTEIVMSQDSMHQAGRPGCPVGESIIDVTNTSNVKVKFKASGLGGGSAGYFEGSSTKNTTYFTFIRLGDT